MNKFKSNFLQSVRLENCEITYDDFDLDPMVSFEKQKWSFKEDILQIEIKKEYLVDVGWYPEHDPKGFFLIRVIKNIDWDNPLFKKKCKSLEVFRGCLQNAIDYANQIKT